MYKTTMLLTVKVITVLRKVAGLHGYFTQISCFLTKNQTISQLFHRNFTRISQFERMSHDLCELI